MSNPFKEWSTSFYDFNVLSDLQRHCTKCELKSWQAKTRQVWKQQWIQLDKDEKDNLYKKIFCNTCKNSTVHRKLKTLEILPDTTVRSWLPPKVVKRVKELYKNEEAVFLREMPTKELEVDHKFPQVRWNKNEEDNRKLTDEELNKKFILLSRSNNLLKSRHCERCFKTWKRWFFPWIKFWYKWEENRDSKINKHDKKWCAGCFRFDPYKRREYLNKKLSWNK